MAVECETCDAIGTRPGTCDRCWNAGRHETAGRMASARVPTVVQNRSTRTPGHLPHSTELGYRASALFEGDFGASAVPMVDLEPASLAIAMSGGPRWWLAKPAEINHPFFGW